MEPPHIHTLNLTGILEESKRIVRSNRTRFLSLSLLFLPLSLSVIINPTLNHHHFTTLYHHLTTLYHLLYVATIITFTLIATATISHTAHHTFLNTPTNPFSSLTSTFFPLLSTTVITYTFLSLFSLSFFCLLNLFLISLQSLGGFVFVDYNSTKFICFSVILCMFLLYMYVNWSLAFVVAVIESKWGFASLTRSAYLVKGMRLVSFKLMLIYGALGGMIVFVYSRALSGYGLMTGWGVFNTLFGSSFLMIFMMQSVVGNVVLYNYCRALHGELAIEVDGGFFNEYVVLSADDEKVPHVVTVVTV